MTNYERIKQMSVEELADLIGQVILLLRGNKPQKYPLTKVGICISKYIKDWLESEATDSDS